MSRPRKNSFLIWPKICPVAPLSRQSLSRHALGEPILSERPDVRRKPVLPAHVIDRMGCVPARYAHVAAAYEAMRIDCMAYGE